VESPFEQRIAANLQSETRRGQIRQLAQAILGHFPKDQPLGILLAGGTGSRLYPLTRIINKHLLPVYDRPMIYYPIVKLTSVGIEQILIVTGVEHMGDVVSLLGSGRDFGCEFTYKVQDEAGGIAEALGLAENFARGQPMAVILARRVRRRRCSPRFICAS